MILWFNKVETKDTQTFLADKLFHLGAYFLQLITLKTPRAIS